MKSWVSIAWNIGWASDGVYRKVFKWVLAICNACDWCRFCDIRFYLQQNKITKILNEKSRRKIFARVENSVYITWHRHRIIFSFLYFFLRLIVVWGPPGGRSLDPRQKLPSDRPRGGRGQERRPLFRGKRHQTDEKIFERKFLITISICSFFVLGIWEEVFPSP